MNFLKPDDSWGGNLHPRQAGPAMAVLCPHCGGSYNHIGFSAKVTGWESRDDKAPVKADLPWVGRGDGVAVLMRCENGHSWALALGHHKGECFLFAVGDTAAEAGAGK